MALPPDGLLAFPAELDVWLKVGEDDPNLLAALTSASRRFKGAVRHPVRLVTGDTTVLPGEGTDRLALPAAPIVQIHSVEVDGEAVTDFKVRRRDGVLLRTGCNVWPDWAEITIVWDHGYDPVPEDVQEVVVDQARVIYRVLPGVQTMQAGGEAVTFGATAATGVTAQWTTVVDNYKINRGDSS